MPGYVALVTIHLHLGEVHDLKAKGVTFETYDMPGVSWDGEIASMEGMGRAAWFKDSEGNTMCLDQVEAG